MPGKVNVSLNGLNDSDALLKASLIHSSLSIHPAFQHEWPPVVPNLAELKQSIDHFMDAIHAAMTRDQVKIAERHASRTTLESHVYYIGHYVEMVARKDPSCLNGTGYDIGRVTTTSRYSGPLGAPTGFAVKHGAQSTKMIARVAKLQGASSFEVQMTIGDPTVEANWSYLGVFAKWSYMELVGLTPGTVYSFRVRGIGANGPGPWSAVTTLMAI